MKKIIITVALIMCCIVGCSTKEINEQELITEYVINNQTKILEIIETINSSSDFNEEDIIRKLPNDINIYNVYKSEQNNYTKFSVDEGTSTPSHYYGFYYSEINEEKNIMGVTGEKKEYKNGYLWEKDGNEDNCYVEKIVDNFFYYEAHY